MASSTNPREFVQRRGRILRTAPGKESALLFDFVVAPDLRADEPNPDVARSLLRRELPRFVEFSTASRNQYGARAVLRPILDSYEMLQLLDQSPWDVYRRNAVEGHNDAW